MKTYFGIPNILTNSYTVYVCKKRKNAPRVAKVTNVYQIPIVRFAK